MNSFGTWNKYVWDAHGSYGDGKVPFHGSALSLGYTCSCRLGKRKLVKHHPCLTSIAGTEKYDQGRCLTRWCESDRLEHTVICTRSGQEKPVGAGQENEKARNRARPVYRSGCSCRLIVVTATFTISTILFRGSAFGYGKQGDFTNVSQVIDLSFRIYFMENTTE